jgi:nucleoside-diphosphate-sugar epimerase
VAVSLPADGAWRARLEEHGVETLAGDLLDEAFLRSLPAAGAVVFMAGRKFGSADDPALTWALNALLPGLVLRRFAGTPAVVFSTGNVYPLMPAPGPGANERQPPDPVGEYAQSCLARERVTQHCSMADGTPAVILRLNYAVDLRYGVLHDIASAVRRSEPVDLRMGHVNVIWQGDACACALRAIAHAAVPPLLLNMTGLDCLSVRDLAERLGALLGVEPRFANEESPTALLSDARALHALLRPRCVDPARMLEWTAAWLRDGGRGYGLPTHFETRNGAY